MGGRLLAEVPVGAAAEGPVPPGAPSRPGSEGNGGGGGEYFVGETLCRPRERGAAGVSGLPFGSPRL